VHFDHPSDTSDGDAFDLPLSSDHIESRSA